MTGRSSTSALLPAPRLLSLIFTSTNTCTTLRLLGLVLLVVGPVRRTGAIGALPGPYPACDACGCSFCPEGLVMTNRAGNFVIPTEFSDAFLGVSEMLCVTINSLAQNGDLPPDLCSDDFRLFDAYRTTCGCPRVADILGPSQSQGMTSTTTSASTAPPQQLDVSAAVPSAVVSSNDFIKCDLCGDGQEVANLVGAYTVPFELQDVLGVEVPCAVEPILKQVGVVGPYAHLCSTDVFLLPSNPSYRDDFRVACQCTTVVSQQLDRPVVVTPVTVTTTAAPSTSPPPHSTARPGADLITTLFAAPPPLSSNKKQSKGGPSDNDDDVDDVDDENKKDQKGDIFKRANNSKGKADKGDANVNDDEKKRTVSDGDDSVVGDGYYTGGYDDDDDDDFYPTSDNATTSNNHISSDGDDYYGDDDHDHEKSEKDDDDDDENDVFGKHKQRKGMDRRDDGSAFGPLTTTVDEQAEANRTAAGTGTLASVVHSNKRVRSSNK